MIGLIGKNQTSFLGGFKSLLNFSTSLTLNKSWRLIECRKTKKVTIPVAGKPRKSKYVPNKPPAVPIYKYGPSHIFKQSNRGLYGGKFIRSGFSYIENDHSVTKNRRKWKLNVLKKKLWSETLGKLIEVKVVASVLRTIEKEGGIDNYLIKEKSARIKELGPFGWQLRYQVLRRMEFMKKPNNCLELHENKGNKTPIYFKVPIKGVEQKIKVGKRKVLANLYHAEKIKLKSGFSRTEFTRQNRDLSIEELIKKLEKLKFDFKKIVVETPTVTKNGGEAKSKPKKKQANLRV
ncbi:mitochondrial 54S ribosomal protein bL28m ASCRUDRAFT_78353 [Ascoidea rubescens DSM 1968]|uniref:Ribosomal protein L28 n=1 Tax=Ascoidea rubescens DSM 1968 TaxID=1344418 RepID=A0A1D2V875_9ASCO|nr:hypothetical protein ASCRUDRAFT_78353 [Ascoidea rubescens DSM 1968]ODV57829.1 hypothetical protein ASCRUDRAFT_78353 [Ascoidea rubescens DSM 1968]